MVDTNMRKIEALPGGSLLVRVRRQACNGNQVIIDIVPDHAQGALGLQKVEVALSI